jgi:hypothetical protein
LGDRVFFYFYTVWFSPCIICIIIFFLSFLLSFLFFDRYKFQLGKFVFTYKVRKTRTKDHSNFLLLLFIPKKNFFSSIIFCFLPPFLFYLLSLCFYCFLCLFCFYSKERKPFYFCLTNTRERNSFIKFTR